MSDWRDVIDARSTAHETMATALHHAEAVPSRDVAPYAFIVALTTCTAAICAELRALGTTIDYAVSNRD